MHSIIAILLITAGLASAAPIDRESEYTTATSSNNWHDIHRRVELSSHISIPNVELPIVQSSEIPTFTVEKRDGRWPWQKEQNVIGKYPDGRLKCGILSMTAGHTEGPCPPKLPQDQIAELLHAEWCRENCCRKNGDPCGPP